MRTLCCRASAPLARQPTRLPYNANRLKVAVWHKIAGANPKTFFAELKRRNVYKVAVAYAVAGWALAQGIAQVFPVFGVPNWVVQLIVLLIVIGFPIALVLAWAFELTAKE